MCGIAGIIYKKASVNAESEIKKITELIAHRGPDGYGYWSTGNVYFGHRRLSIIDLSNAGAQPMEYNGYVITYNGEVYNYLEVKADLEKIGYTFKSHSDTEVILAAYQCWGANCLPRFNGMWSFAIYDPYKKIVFCSRDRFGVKPFYYLKQDDKLVFGSEIKQLLPFLNSVKANVQALTHYLAFTLIDGNEHTFFEGVKNLPGSHYLIYDLEKNSIEISKYYSITTHDEYKRINYDEALHLFQKHFERSINWRLRSDVRVGTCLSGGLDSSFIALIAADNYKGSQPFCAFTTASIDAPFSDEPYAKKVADALKLEWHVITPSVADFQNDIMQVCGTMEEPTVSPSVFMQHYVMRIAHERGLKVLLDGQGADETLFGYTKYIAAMGRQLSGADKLRFLMQAQKKYKLSRTHLLSIYYYFSNWPVRKKYAAYKLRGIRPHFFDSIDEPFFKRMADAYKNPLELQKLEIMSTQIPALLRYEDRNSMHYSIETRLPFLDWELVEFNLSLPIDFKIQNGWSKYPIRKSMDKRLPDDITWRKNKFGFNSPDKDWLNASDEFKIWIRESAILNKLFVNPLAIAHMKNGMLWKMINIACWEKIYNVTM
ncbi:asparagine synthase (glutamine-hydrolyzing) [soil metagenome]